MRPEVVRFAWMVAAVAVAVLLAVPTAAVLLVVLCHAKVRYLASRFYIS